MRVIEVKSKEDIQSFLDLSKKVYEGNPYWVPQTDDHIASFLEGTSPFCKHCKTKAFIISDETGRTLGRILAQIDYVFNWHWGEEIGHLLFFEALPNNSEAVKTLIAKACLWLKKEKMDQARLSYLHGRQLPLTIDGYNETPLVHHTYNPAYYHSYIKGGGFRTEHGFVESHIELTVENLAKYTEYVDTAKQNGITLRKFNRDQIKEETQKFRAMHNETFESHWGATQLNYEETLDLTASELADIIFAEDASGTIGFGLAFPDLNQVAKTPTQGPDKGIFPLDHITRSNILLAGVIKSARGKGVVRAISAKLLLNMKEKGFKSATHSIAMDINSPSRRFAERLGAVPKRSYVTYCKHL